VSAAPLPGDIALTRISGFTGKAISAGQALIGRASPVQHAMIYVGSGMVVQAMPGGAELIPLADANEPVIWSTGAIVLTAAQRSKIATAARGLVGTPYSYVDYGSIGLAAAHIRPRFVRDYVADTGHMICSQLVDYAHFLGGSHLFTDGRIPGDVTPSDLYALFQERAHLNWLASLREGALPL
jgi:cell wall-associated NlpC family hydrolase